MDVQHGKTHPYAPEKGDATWKTVYSDKHMEEERSTISKKFETITKSETQKEKSVLKTPEAHKIISLKSGQTLLDRENWKTSGNAAINLGTTATCFPSKFDNTRMDDKFFEDLIAESKEKMQLKDRFMDTFTTKESHKKLNKELKHEQKGGNVGLRFQSMGPQCDDLFLINENNREEKFKSSTEKADRNIKSQEEEVVYARSSYKEWKNLKDNLFKEFEDVVYDKQRREESHGGTTTGCKEYEENSKVKTSTPSEIIDAPKPDSNDWIKCKKYFLEESAQKCKNQEFKMVEKLKEIDAIVKDVKILSEKHPTLLMKPKHRQIDDDAITAIPLSKTRSLRNFNTEYLSNHTAEDKELTDKWPSSSNRYVSKHTSNPTKNEGSRITYLTGISFCINNGSPDT